MKTIFLKEINEFLHSLVAYIAISIFLVVTGLYIWVYPVTNILDYGYATLEPLFSVGPFVLMFLVPAVTMRMIAEERRNGTLELLFTLPFKSSSILFGKYLAGCALVTIAILPSFLYYYSVYYLGNPPGNLDSSGIFGSYLGLLLLGYVFTAIGLLASALSKSQMVAYVIAAFLCFVLYQGFDALYLIDSASFWAYWLQQLGLSFHYNAMSKGLIELRDLVYFGGLISLLLTITYQQLNRAL